MILIISDVGGSINDVIDWIASKNIVVHRLNPLYDKSILIHEITLNDGTSDIEISYKNNVNTKFSDYNSIWIWHSNLKFANAEAVLTKNENNDITKKIMQNINQHHRVLINYLGFYLYLNKEKVIGNYTVQSLNKLEVLHRAKKIGINIPESFIVTKKKRLIELFQKKSYITKPYYETSYIEYGDIGFQNYTTALNKVDFLSMEEDIFPTLIQEKIEKEFELRIFYIQGQFFSMAIFSQQSSKTEVDFRNYNFDNPNRTVPYKLPKNIEKKFSLLFGELKLNCGSIDMIYSKNKKLIFMEINPVGQFGMISIPCNYYLEEILMKILTYDQPK